MTIHNYLLLLVGPSGRYLSALWDANEILAHIFPDVKMRACHATATRMINGHKSISARYVLPYLDAKECDTIINNLRMIVFHYPSMAMLLDIMARMRLAVAASGWPAEQIETLDRYYVADNPSRDDVATYLAHVLRHVLYSQYLLRFPA